MIVRWPGNQAAGTVRDELASTLDLVPTFLTAAGIDVPDALPGKPLLPLLKDGPTPDDWRQHTIGFTTGAASGTFYFQQSIRGKRYKLILNPLAESPSRKNLFAEAYLKQHNSHFAAGCMVDEIATASETVQQAYERFLTPPLYELYDLQNDPHEFVNLADSPSHAVIKDRLASDFRAWQKATSDPFADAGNLKSFTQSQLDAIDKNYRRDKKFRWPYLDEFGK